MSILVEVAARRQSVARTGFEYDMLLEEQQAALMAEVRSVIEACAGEELLEALKRAEATISREEHYQKSMQPALVAIRAAIAKATGEEAA